MGYCTACDVYALVKNLILPSGSFDANTCPTLNDINSFISSGCSVIETDLADAGFGAIPLGSMPYGMATTINAYFAAWEAESSRLSAMVQAGERTRADVFFKNWNAMLTILSTRDLSRAGVPAQSGAYAGGISRSDKAAVSGNSDRVAPRFSRGMGHNPAAGWPPDNNPSSAS
jgi:hypothetical protein